MLIGAGVSALLHLPYLRSVPPHYTIVSGNHLYGLVAMPIPVLCVRARIAPNELILDIFIL